MKILFIGPFPEPVTGQSLACQVLLDSIKDRHQVDCIDLNKRGFSQGLSSIGRLAEVCRIVFRAWRKSHAADVIYLTTSESYAGNAKDLLILMFCARRLRRIVVHLHGGAGMRVIMKKGPLIVRAVNRGFSKRLGAVIVLGESLKDIYIDTVVPERLAIIPNFAEDEMFINREEILRKFRSTSPMRLLFLSNLLPGKGHHELVAAYLGLDAKRRREITIDFAGSFADQRQRDEFLEKIHGHEGLVYHGAVRGEEKRRLFREAHVFCLPTYYPYEGQPISILEAYASGCVVITTGHSGIPDVFTDHVNGLLVKTRSVDSIQSAMVAAVEGPLKMLDVALHNREVAELSYRASRYTADVERVFHSIRGA